MGKEEAKLPLFSEDMILYIKDPQNSTKKVVGIINPFSKVAGYKINTQKSVAFLYTNYVQTEKEIIYNSLKNNKAPCNKFNERKQRPF
jgi:hypothetical protein